MEQKFLTKCNKCYRGTWYETEQQCHCKYPKLETCKECGHSEYVLDDDECMIEIRCAGTLKLVAKK